MFDPVLITHFSTTKFLRGNPFLLFFFHWCIGLLVLYDRKEKYSPHILKNYLLLNGGWLMSRCQQQQPTEMPHCHLKLVNKTVFKHR